MQKIHIGGKFEPTKNKEIMGMLKEKVGNIATGYTIDGKLITQEMVDSMEKKFPAKKEKVRVPSRKKIKKST